MVYIFIYDINEFDNMLVENVKNYRYNLYYDLFVQLERVDKSEDPNFYNIPMAVTYDDIGKICLVYNPFLIVDENDFNQSLLISGLLYHEIMHIILGHLDKQKEWLSLYPNFSKMINVAMDLEINTLMDDKLVMQSVVKGNKSCVEINIAQYLDKHYDCLLPQKFGFPKKETFEFYLSLLIKEFKNDDNLENFVNDNFDKNKKYKNHQKKDNDECNKNEDFKNGYNDKHDCDKNESYNTGKISKKEIEKYENNMNQDTTSYLDDLIKCHKFSDIDVSVNARQNMINHCKDYIKNYSLEDSYQSFLNMIAMNNKITIPFVRHFRHFIHQCSEKDKKRTYSVPSILFYKNKGNKKLLQKGVKKIKRYSSTIAVGIDTSASMNVDDLQNILNIIYTYKATNKDEIIIDIVMIDTNIKHVYYDTNVDDLKILDFIGGGGTKLQPFFDYVSQNKNKYDSCILLTDGYVGEVYNDPKIPICIVLSSGIDKEEFMEKNISNYPWLNLSILNYNNYL